MKIAFYLFLAIGVLITPAATARANDALINAVSYEKFGQDLPISVRPLDNSDINLALQKTIEDSLRAKGYTVLDNAGLVFSFDTENVSGAWSNAGDRQLIELKNQDGTPHSNNPEVRLNLFNSSRGGVFNPGRPGTSQVTPTIYRLNATLENSANGQRLWEGWTKAELGLADEATLSRAMVPILLNALGKTIRQKKTSLY